MEYLVARKGHKIGHRPLVFGEVVNARKLGVTAEALKPFIARGVLKPAKPKVSRPTTTVNDKTDE